MSETKEAVDEIFSTIKKELGKLNDIEKDLREALGHSDEVTKVANKEVVTAIKSVKEANKGA